MNRRCCAPNQLDDDRTHSVRYRQASFRDGRLLREDQGTAEIACTHNDAISDATLVAARFEDVDMKPRGRNGSWFGSEIAEGDGTQAEVWISRGPAEEDYDNQKRRERFPAD